MAMRIYTVLERQGDLRQRRLEAAGYEVTGVVSGSGLADAERRLFQSLGPIYFG